MEVQILRGERGMEDEGRTVPVSSVRPLEAPGVAPLRYVSLKNPPSGCGWSPRSWTISWAEQSLIFFIERNVMEGRKWMKESVWSYVCGWVGGWYRIIMVRKV